ncbi:MAG: hypothetical protein SH847_17400 [Roseiflexaceae bacterium]|nr:hypothetical protein [Roseiflexaceae bacterium]
MFHLDKALDDYDLRIKLQKFRRNFLRITADNQYPPERQQFLYQWCLRGQIDWNVARQFVAPEAMALFQRIAQRYVENGRLSAAEVAELQLLQRRLGLTNDQTALGRIYELIERKLKDLVIERAAYLGSQPAYESLRAIIQSYQLPEEQQRRLTTELDRQAQLARLTAGNLPTIAAPVTLYRDEACHLSLKVSCVLPKTAASRSGNALLIVTSERLILLSPGGGTSDRWDHITHIRFVPPLCITWESSSNDVTVFLREDQDPQYVATLISSASRKYHPNAPEAVRPPKRLIYLSFAQSNGNMRGCK